MEVNFRIDVNGIVTVFASDLYTERETGIEIDASHLLSEEEVALALQEADSAAREDMKRREETENLIRADSMIRAAELVLEKRREKRTGAFEEQIEDAIFRLQDAIFEGDPPIITELTGQLRELLKEVK